MERPIQEQQVLDQVSIFLEGVSMDALEAMINKGDEYQELLPLLEAAYEAKLALTEEPEEDLIFPHKPYSLQDPAFLQFINSRDALKTMWLIRSISVGDNAILFEKVTEKLLPRRICKQSLYLFGQPSKLKDFELIPIPDPNLIRIISNDPKEITTILSYISDVNSKALLGLRDCKEDYMYLNLNLIIPKRIIEYLKQDTLHSTVVIVNLITNQIYYIEPSITGGITFHRFEAIILDALKEIISRAVGRPFTAQTYLEEQCPLFAVQGTTGLCSYFSFFMMILFIFNGSRRKVYSWLEKLTQEERIRLLAEFIYHVYLSTKDMPFYRETEGNIIDKEEKYRDQIISYL